MTGTNPASSAPPSRNVSASSQSWKVTSASKHFSVSAHQAHCSGRVELRAAASLDSNLTMARKMLSSVMAYVPPSQPSAFGPSSRRHMSICRRSASESWQVPWMIWMNISEACDPRAVSP